MRTLPGDTYNECLKDLILMNMINTEKKVWALFSDGTAEPVHMERGPAAKYLELEAKGLEHSKVVRSSEKALHAAYNVIREAGNAPGDHLGLTYGFKKRGLLIETDASLAFAVKLVEQVLGLGFSVAAMGSVSGDDPTAGVDPVDAKNINDRLTTAMGVLSPGDMVLIPRGNLVSVAPEIKKMIAGKGLSLVAVSTMEEAVQNVLGQAVRTPPAPGKGKMKKKNRLVKGGLYFFLVLVLFLAVLAWFFVAREPAVSPGPEPIPASIPAPDSKAGDTKTASP